jgi:hypothetical protein
MRISDLCLVIACTRDDNVEGEITLKQRTFVLLGAHPNDEAISTCRRDVSLFLQQRHLLQDRLPPDEGIVRVKLMGLDLHSTRMPTCSASKRLPPTSTSLSG